MSEAFDRKWKKFALKWAYFYHRFLRTPLL